MLRVQHHIYIQGIQKILSPQEKNLAIMAAPEMCFIKRSDPRL